MTVDRINLLPPEILARRQAHSKYVLGLVAGAFVLAAVGLIYLFLSAQVTVERQKLDNLKAEYARLDAADKAYQKYKDEEKELVTAESLISSVKTKVVSWSDILDHVGFIIPDDVQLTAFDGGSESSPPTVSLTGSATTFEGLASFIVRLQNSEKFDQVALNTTGLDPKTKAVTFTVTVTVAGVGDGSAEKPKPSGG